MKTEFLLLCAYLAAVEFSDAYIPRKIACPQLKLRYGRVRIRARTFAQFSCSRGYLLAGEKYTKCTSGEWDSPPPVCVRPNCRKIQQLKNGVIHPSHRGAVLNFYCGANFVLQGPSRAYCIDTKWDAHMPSCLSTNATPSMNCDFETEDVCGWSHDLNHNFDWTRLNRRTPSGHLATGPSEDHTKGPGGNGYYMYIEGSTKNVNDTARLISPMYKRESNNTCLEFYYHMYGSGIGQLRVYVKKINESWDLKLEDAIFRKEGNQGNEWFRAFVELGPINDEFQIIFEGVRGISYVSDIAIDDLKIIENCRIETMTTIEQIPEAITSFYDSCNNKCNTTASVNMSCSCEENCYENNTCCGDYVAVCVLGNDMDTTDDDTSDTNTYTSDVDADGTSTMAATVLPSVQTQKLQEYTTPPFTVPQTTKENRLPETTTPSKTTTVSITKPRTAKTTIYEPIIAEITTTTQQQQQRETVITSTASTATTVRFRDTTLPTVPIPTEKSRDTTATKYFYNDMLTLPEDVTTEEDVYIVDITEQNRETFTKEYPLSDRDSEPELSDKVYPVQERPTPSNKTTVIAVLTMCFIVVGVLGLIFLAKRYTSKNCVRRMRSGNGDSQSDVRFLTNDEILDFRLAKF